MKQILYTGTGRLEGWWIAWPMTGSNELLNWLGPYRWRWQAAFMRWWRFR